MSGLGTHYLEWIWAVQRRSKSVEVTHHNTHPQTHTGHYLYSIYWLLSVGEPNIGALSSYGPSDSINYLSDNLHLSYTTSKQGLEYCPILSSKIRPEYNHSYDGSNISCVFCFLCLNQYWGNETFHFSSLERTVSYPDDNRSKECNRDAWAAQSLTTSHKRKWYWYFTARCQLEGQHNEQVHLYCHTLLQLWTCDQRIDPLCRTCS